jgi:hypothetical protein
MTKYLYRGGGSVLCNRNTLNQATIKKLLEISQAAERANGEILDGVTTGNG